MCLLDAAYAFGSSNYHCYYIFYSRKPNTIRYTVLVHLGRQQKTEQFNHPSRVKRTKKKITITIADSYFRFVYAARSVGMCVCAHECDPNAIRNWHWTDDKNVVASFFFSHERKKKKLNKRIIIIISIWMWLQSASSTVQHGKETKINDWYS